MSNVQDIVGTGGDEFRGRRILIAVTGSVSAYRAVDIAREFIRHGADVFAVMSQMAQEIIDPNLLEWATGNPVVTKLTGKIEHVEFTTGHLKADLLIIAPCTANTIGKIACGIDDTPITSFATSALGAGLPIVIAPAMHDTMYEQPIVQQNIRKLAELGVEFVEPTEEEEKAKLASLDEIFRTVLDAMPKRDYVGRRVLITLGPTFEHIDPIRIITNPSSGKMGSALAFEANKRGAGVTIIHGPVQVALPYHARKIPVRSTNEMYNEVMKELKSSAYDMVLATAAPADYAPLTGEKKIRTADNARIILELSATPKIIDEIKKTSPRTFLVAFRAQTGLRHNEFVSDGFKRLQQASADLIAVNDVGRTDIGFGSDFNELILIDQRCEEKIIKRGRKRTVAKQLLDEISYRLEGAVPTG